MEKVKVYIEIPNRLERELYNEGRNLEMLLQQSGATIFKEEVKFKDKPATRDLFTGLLIGSGFWILTHTGRITFDEIFAPTIRKFFRSLKEKIFKQEKDNSVKYDVIIFFIIENDNGEKELFSINQSSKKDRIIIDKDILIRIIEIK